MPTEIERKFLVSGRGWRTATGQRISQGYLNRDKRRTVRVRLAGEIAFLTVKGITIGASRTEFEYQIPVDHAEAMLRLCDGPVIEKIRHRVVHSGVVWEIDEFFGDNAGLVVAEVELESEQQDIDLPAWVTQEVTEDPRYFNSNLATRPFNLWSSAGDT